MKAALPPTMCFTKVKMSSSPPLLSTGSTALLLSNPLSSLFDRARTHQLLCEFAKRTGGHEGSPVPLQVRILPLRDVSSLPFRSIFFLSFLCVRATKITIVVIFVQRRFCACAISRRTAMVNSHSAVRSSIMQRWASIHEALSETKIVERSPFRYGRMKWTVACNDISSSVFMGRWRVLPKHKADSGIWLKFPGFNGRLKCGECVKKGQ